MGKSSPSSPPPVDQGALIEAQAEANRVNTFTPLGNQFFGTVAEQLATSFVEACPPQKKSPAGAGLVDWEWLR
jgi:hypothetical protein